MKVFVGVVVAVGAVAVSAVAVGAAEEACVEAGVVAFAVVVGAAVVEVAGVAGCLGAGADVGGEEPTLVGGMHSSTVILGTTGGD